MQVTPAFAALEWPSNVSVEAEGAVLMDARSGAVIYGKNLHAVYYPASITKILTALIVIEHCNLDDVVTFPRCHLQRRAGKQQRRYGM